MMPLRPPNCIGAPPRGQQTQEIGGHSMSPVSTRFLIASALACAGLIAPAAALAQPAPSATPAAQPTTPAAPPSWQQGRPPEQSDSTLHPFAPQMTGRPASGLPIDKLKVPAGFKVEVWVDGVPEARSLARRQGHGVREQPPRQERVRGG